MLQNDQRIRKFNSTLKRRKFVYFIWLNWFWSIPRDMVSDKL